MACTRHLGVSGRYMHQADITRSRAHMMQCRARMWSAALQPDGACAARLASLALAVATAHQGTASCGHANTRRWRCMHHPRGATGVARPSPHAAGMASLWARSWHAAVVGGTCRRVAKRGPAARRYDAEVYRRPTGAARGGPRELRRCARSSLFWLISTLAAAHPTTFRQRPQRATAAPAATPCSP